MNQFQQTYSCCGGLSKVLRRVMCAMLLFAGSSSWSQAPQEAGTSLKPTATGTGYTLHVTTREVVIEVVARDRRNHPVNDLKQSDFQVFDSTHKDKEGIKLITGFRTIDPASQASDQASDQSGDQASDPAHHAKSVVLPLGGRCEILSNVHYELAFHPSKWTSGYHSIVVTTTRRHISLSYRTQYYVGVAEPPTNPAPAPTRDIASRLLSAACYHPDVPPSLFLAATRLPNQDPSTLRYLVTLLPGSLDLAGLTESSQHLQLDYAVCLFSRSGGVVHSWHFSEDRVLSPEDLNSVLRQGWQQPMEVPRTGRPALARFVVLEPKSGNLGIIDLSISTHTDADVSGPDVAVGEATRNLVAPENPSGATSERSPLGSSLPRAGALCGDVYELPTTTTLLPADFRLLNAVGAVYTTSLNIPEQSLRHGIPGSTPRSEWFGIDYYGQFWITKAGKYRFVLNADDGADLFIDDRQLIADDGIHPPQTFDASITLHPGRHTLHMPYFQGPTYVNLILQIEPPDGDLKTFDVRDYPNPRAAAIDAKHQTNQP